MVFNPMDNKPCIFKKGVNCNQDFSEFIGRKTYFIACPSSDEISLEIDAIKSVLTDEGITPIIATEYDTLNEEILCSKICKNIIGSSFCMAVLTEVSHKNHQKTPGENTPNDVRLEANANVYFEYGIMTALYKNMVPIQKSGQQPKFDNQNLNLVIYDEINSLNSKQFKDKIQEKIRDIKFDESFIGERQKRVLDSLDRELKKNYENVLYFRGLLTSITNEAGWIHINDQLNRCQRVYYDEFKKNYITKIFDEKDEHKVIDAYEMLDQCKDKAQSSLETYRHNGYTPDSINAYHMGERFRDIMEKLYPILKEAILSIKKENMDYIKANGGL